MDVALELVIGPEYLWYVQKFQSLFSWMSLWNPTPIQRLEFRVCVSILVFVDVALERSVPVPRSRAVAHVSILVFVDVALEQAIKEGTITELDGFNPCFRGCRSGTGRPSLHD